MLCYAIVFRTEWVDAINKVSKLLRKKADSMDTQASSFKTASSTSDTKENEKVNSFSRNG